MRKKLTNNFGLKLISLMIAIVLWMVVLSIEDPVYTREFADIVVTEVNGEQITEAGKAYSYVGGNTVAIKVTGKTSILSKVLRDDFVAVADLSKMSITGAVDVDVTCPRFPSLEITPMGSGAVLNVEIEDLAEKALNVKVITKGASEGKYVAQGTATPNMITVSGPVSEIQKISEAVVYVTVTNANMTDITTNTNIVLLDAQKEIVSQSNLTISQTTIDVTVPILEVKTVPIIFQAVGDPEEGYVLTNMAYEPKSVAIAGRAAQLLDIKEIVISDYDISGMNESVEATLMIDENMASTLPFGIQLADKDASVAIKVEIEKVVEETLQVPLANISVKNNRSVLSYTKTGNDSEGKYLEITVKGVESEVNALKAEDIKGVVDVSGLGEGTYELEVELNIKQNVELTKTPKTNIDITQKGE